MRRKPLTLLASATVAVLVLAGCSGGDADAPGSTPEAPGGTAAGTPAGTAEPSRASSSPGDPLPVLDSRETSDRTGIPLRIEVNELERRGDLVVLNLTVINLLTDDSDSFQVSDFFDDRDRTEDADAQKFSLDGVTLVDSANSKRHLVARDSEGACLCSSGLSASFVGAGERLGLTATFGAPPSGVSEMDVGVPGAGTFTAVPLS